jgi:L-2-hydroxyglutarate oxidase LhgO
MTSNHNLPQHASVIVIGGGVMGCSTLYHLAKTGVSDAILLERNELTSGTTWHSAAQVRALRSSKNLTDLIRYSISLYSSLEQETGQATGWINKGSLSIATNPDRLTFIKRQEALAEMYAVSAKSISVGEAQERWPMMYTGDVIGAARVRKPMMRKFLSTLPSAESRRATIKSSVSKPAQAKSPVTRSRSALACGVAKTPPWPVSRCRSGPASTFTC